MSIIEFLKENDLDYRAMYTPLIDAYGKLNNIYIQNDFQISTVFFVKSIVISVLISFIEKLGNQWFFFAMSFRFQKHGEDGRWEGR